MYDFVGFGNVDTQSLNEKRQNIILLSTSANIVSKVTAFVAIDKEAGKQVEGEMAKRSCPVPVATPEFSDAVKSTVFGGQERFRSLAVSWECASGKHVHEMHTPRFPTFI